MELKERVVNFLRGLQKDIVAGLEKFESTHRFTRTSWQRPGGGGGESCVMAEGDVFEKAGVNLSIVHGELGDKIRKKMGVKEAGFFATGVSLVIHPRSPCIPTVHANYRYFEQPDRSWFGGGADLTPYVIAEESFKNFHRVHREVCEAYQAGAYQAMKKKCDEYFFLSHRGETRGIGGIFFDYLSGDMEKIFSFVQAAGNAFLKAYAPAVQAGLGQNFLERQKRYQLLRRGRYVEFNLIHDRGTLFGLETKGNTESILMSLPPEVRFEYLANLETTAEEKQIMSWLKQPIEWA